MTTRDAETVPVAAVPIDRRAAPPLLQLARDWFVIGTQSFGGGPSTLYLIRNILVLRRRWITEREYNETWALSQLSLGVHLVAMAGLLGYRARGVRGVAIAVAAMLVPSAVVTVLLTAGYAAVETSPLVQAALLGVSPMTAAMTVGLGAVFARAAARPGRAGVFDRLAVVLIAVAVFLGVSVLVAIAAGAAVGAVAMRSRPPSEPAAEATSA